MNVLGKSRMSSKLDIERCQSLILILYRVLYLLYRENIKWYTKKQHKCLMKMFNHADIFVYIAVLIKIKFCVENAYLYHRLQKYIGCVTNIKETKNGDIWMLTFHTGLNLESMLRTFKNGARFFLLLNNNHFS